MTRVVSFSRLMKSPTLAGMTDAQRLRQHDVEVASGRVLRPMRLGRLDLAAGDGLQAATNVLGHVGGREEGDAADRPSDAVDAGSSPGRKSGSMMSARNRIVTSGTPRIDLDVGRCSGCGRRAGWLRRPRASSTPSGNESSDADRGEQDGQQQAAPQVRADRRAGASRPIAAAGAGTRAAGTAASRWRSAGAGTRPRSRDRRTPTTTRAALSASAAAGTSPAGETSTSAASISWQAASEMASARRRCP